jgi:hypothetical protein
MAVAVEQPKTYDADGLAIDKTETSTAVLEPEQEQTTKVDETETQPDETTKVEGSTSETTTEEKTVEDQEKKDETHDVRRMKKFMREAAMAKAELAAYKEAKEAFKPQPQNLPPDRSQFKTDAEYLAAAVQFEVKKQLPILQQQTQPVQASVDEVKKTFPDYDEVMLDAESVTIPDVTVNAVLGSPIRDHLRYYLVKHPEKAEGLYKMSPERALAEIGKIEAHLETVITPKKETVRVSSARAPITPVKLQGSTGKVDENKLSDQDWFRLEQKRQMEKNKKRILLKG